MRDFGSLTAEEVLKEMRDHLFGPRSAVAVLTMSDFGPRTTVAVLRNA